MEEAISKKKIEKLIDKDKRYFSVIFSDSNDSIPNEIFQVDSIGDYFSSKLPHFAVLTLPKVLNFGKQEKLDEYIEYEKVEKEMKKKSTSELETQKSKLICNIYRKRIEQLIVEKERALAKFVEDRKKQLEDEYEENLVQYEEKKRKLESRLKRERKRKFNKNFKQRSSRQSSRRSTPHSNRSMKDGTNLLDSPGSLRNSLELNDGLQKSLEEMQLEEEVNRLKEPTRKEVDRVEAPYLYLVFQNYPKTPNEIESMLENNVNVDVVMDIKVVEKKGPPNALEKENLSGRKTPKKVKKKVTSRKGAHEKKDDKISLYKQLKTQVDDFERTNKFSLLRAVNLIQREFFLYTYDETNKSFEGITNDKDFEYNRLLSDFGVLVKYLVREKERQFEGFIQPLYIPKLNSNDVEIDMESYKKMLAPISKENQSIPVILHALVEQVCVNVNRNSEKIEKKKEKKKEGEQVEEVKVLNMKKENEILLTNVFDLIDSEFSNHLESEISSKKEEEEEKEEETLEKNEKDITKDYELLSYWDKCALEKINNKESIAGIPIFEIEKKMLKLLYDHVKVILPNKMKDQDKKAQRLNFNELKHFISRNEKNKNDQLHEDELVRSLAVNSFSEMFKNVKEYSFMEELTFDNFVQSMKDEMLLNRPGFLQKKMDGLSNLLLFGYFYDVPMERYVTNGWVKKFSCQRFFSEIINEDLIKFLALNQKEYEDECAKNLSKLRNQREKREEEMKLRKEEEVKKKKSEKKAKKPVSAKKKRKGKDKKSKKDREEDEKKLEEERLNEEMERKLEEEKKEKLKKMPLKIKDESEILKLIESHKDDVESSINEEINSQSEDTFFVTQVKKVNYRSSNINERYTFEGYSADLFENQFVFFPSEDDTVIKLLTHGNKEGSRRNTTCTVERTRVGMKYGFRSVLNKGKVDNAYFTCSFDNKLTIIANVQKRMERKEHIVKKLIEGLKVLEIPEEIPEEKETKKKDEGKKKKKSKREKKEEAEEKLKLKEEEEEEKLMKMKQIQKEKNNAMFYVPKVNSSSVHFGFPNGLYVKQKSDGSIMQFKLQSQNEKMMKPKVLGSGFAHLKYNKPQDMHISVSKEEEVLEIWDSHNECVTNIRKREISRTVLYSRDVDEICVLREMNDDVLQLLYATGTISTKSTDGYWLIKEHSGKRYVRKDASILPKGEKPSKSDCVVNMKPLSFAVNTDLQNDCKIYSREDYLMKVLYNDGVEFLQHVDGTTFWVLRGKGKVIIDKVGYAVVEVDFKDGSIAFEELMSCYKKDRIISKCFPEKKSLTLMKGMDAQFTIDFNTSFVVMDTFSKFLHESYNDVRLPESYGLCSVNYKEGGMKCIDLEGNEFVINSSGKSIVRKKSATILKARELCNEVMEFNKKTDEEFPYITLYKGSSGKDFVEKVSKRYEFHTPKLCMYDSHDEKVYDFISAKKMFDFFHRNGIDKDGKGSENGLINIENVNAKYDKLLFQRKLNGLKKCSSLLKEQIGEKLDPNSILSFHRDMKSILTKYEKGKVNEKLRYVVRKLKRFKDVSEDKKKTIESEFKNWKEVISKRKKIKDNQEVKENENEVPKDKWKSLDDRTEEEKEIERKIIAEIERLVEKEKERKFLEWEKAQLIKRQEQIDLNSSRAKIMREKKEKEKHVQEYMEKIQKEKEFKRVARMVEKKEQMKREREEEEVRRKRLYWEEDFSKNFLKKIKEKEAQKVRKVSPKKKVIEVNVEKSTNDSKILVEPPKIENDLFEVEMNESEEDSMKKEHEESEIETVKEMKIKKKKSTRKVKKGKGKLKKISKVRAVQKKTKTTNFAKMKARKDTVHPKVFFNKTSEMENFIPNKKRTLKLEKDDNLSQIRVSPERIDFGRVRIGMKKRMVAQIKNFGKSPGRINIKYINGKKKPLKLTYKKGPIAPGISKRVVFEFKANKKEDFEMKLKVTTDSHIVWIPITAEAYE